MADRLRATSAATLRIAKRSIPVKLRTITGA